MNAAQHMPYYSCCSPMAGIIVVCRVPSAHTNHDLFCNIRSLLCLCTHLLLLTLTKKPNPRRKRYSMLSVSPPAPPSGMAFIEEARSTKRRRFEDTHDPYYVAPHDVDLNGAFTWSDGQSDQEQGCEKGLSSSSSLQSDGDVGDQERASPSSSISPMSSVGPVPTAQCLLIRSMHQGWERTFELHHDWPIPRIQRPDEVLISHRAVGLNPVDFKRCVWCGFRSGRISHS